MSKFFIQVLILSFMPWAATTALEIKTENAPHHGHKLDQLSRELGLTADQQIKLKDLFKANKEKLKALKESNRDQLKTAVTPEQKNALHDLYKQRKNALKGLDDDMAAKKIQTKVGSK